MLFSTSRWTSLGILLGAALVAAPASAQGCNPSTQEIADCVPGGRGGPPTSGRGQTVSRPNFGNGGGGGGGYNPAGVANSAGLIGTGAANFLGGLSGLLGAQQQNSTSPRCQALKENANNAAAGTRDTTQRTMAYQSSRPAGPCDSQLYELNSAQMAAVINQKRAFQEALLADCGFERHGPDASYDDAIAQMRKLDRSCRSSLSASRNRPVVEAAAETWKRKCERLEQRRQSEAASCWGGLAGSTEARGDQALIDYAKGRAAAVAFNGPEGEAAQETMPIAPGCNFDFPIRRTGAVCRGVPGAITVGSRTACCVATRSMREQLRERLQNTSN